MALQLESLVFSVSTEALDEARIKIAKLGDAVNSLNRPMQDFARSSAKTAEAIAKSELAAEKARAAKEKLADSASTVTAKVDPLTKLMEKLSNTYTDMANGMTKGESSILNQARSYGAMGDQLKAVADILQNIKTLNKDPFDASLGGVRSITQEFERLQQRADLAAQGILMTTKQLGEYSKLAAEARGRVVGLGMDPDSLEGQRVYNQLLSQSQKEYLDVLSVVKQLTDAEQQRLAVAKEQERLQKAAASASAARMQEWAKSIGDKSPELTSMADFYKQQEVAARKLTAAQDDLLLREEKLAFVNKELAAGLTTASANALFKYQKDLEAVGETADNVARRTAAFREGLVERQSHSPIGRIADDARNAREEVNHLSRAIGVQLGDVVVSLAGGMNLFQVLIQQGDQLRFAVQNAKEEGEDLDVAMKNALKSIYTSFIDTGKVIGEFFVNAIKDTGSAITDFITQVTGVGPALSSISEFFEISPTILAAIPIAIGAITAAIAAFSIAGVIAFFQVEKQMKEFTKNLILTGGSLGMTTDSAISLANSMNDIGVSSSEALEVMQAMAKAGGFVRSEIQMITQSATEMQTWLGVSVEDTVGQFSKLKDDPVKALFEVAIKTGEVNSAILETVSSLQEQGKQSEAAAIAMQTYADVTIGQVKRVKEEYTSFARLMIEIGDGLGKFWDGIKEMWIKATPREQLSRDLTRLNAMISTPGIGADYKKQLETQRDELTKQFMTLEKIALNKEQTLALDSASNKVLQEANKVIDDNLNKLTKLENKRTASNNLLAERRKDFEAGIIDSTAWAAAQKANSIEVAKIEKDIAEEKKKNNAESLSAAKKLEDQRKKDLNVYKDIIGKSEGLNKSYNDSVDALDRLLKAGKDGGITQWEYNKAFQALYEQQPGYVKQQQEMKKGVDDLNKSTTDFNNKILESQAATAKEREELASMTAMLGMTEEQQKSYTIQYQKSLKLKQLDIDLEKELRAIQQDPSIADNPYIRYDREQKAIRANADKRQLVEDQASYEIAKKQAEEFKKVQDDISGIIADALFEGGKKGADSLKSYLNTTFRKYVIDVLINPIVGQMMGSLGVQGGASSAAGSFLGNMGSSLLGNAVGTISGVASAFGTAFSNAALSTVQGWVGMSGTAAQMSTSLANVGYYAGSAAGTTASGIGASIGTYAPYVLAGIAAYELLSGNGETRSGATYVQGSNGLATYQQGPSGGEIAGQVSRDLFNSTKSSIENTLKLVGSSATLTGFTAGLESSNNGKGFAFAGGFIDGQSFGASSGREGYRTGQWSYRSMSSQEAFSAYVSELNKATLEALLAARDVPNLIKNQLQGIDFKAINEADVGKLVNAVNETIAAVNDFITQINWMGIEGLSNIDFSKASGLVESFGSVGKASESLSYFYENFYSDAEKTDNLSKKLTKSFSALGFEMPKTRDEFKKLVLSVIELGDPALLKDVLSLQDAFVSMTETAVNSFKELTNGIQSEIDRLLGANLTSASSTIQGSAMRTEFDVLSALARGGDATALAKLPEFSQAIEKNMTDFASSASDVIFARAMLAQSLSDTMSSLGGNTTVVPSAVGITGAVGSVSTVSSVSTAGTSLSAAASSQSDLISMLVAEIQGLRAEVRADVSANTKTSKILERANQDGESISISGSIDGGII